MNTNSLIDVNQYTTQQTIKRFEEWKETNPQAYAYIFSLADIERIAKRSFSMRTCLERARWKDFTDINGKKTRIPNEYSPLLAREYALKHKEASHLMTFRPSKFDRMKQNGR